VNSRENLQVVNYDTVSLLLPTTGKWIESTSQVKQHNVREATTSIEIAEVCVQPNKYAQPRLASSVSNPHHHILLVECHVNILHACQTLHDDYNTVE